MPSAGKQTELETIMVNEINQTHRLSLTCGIIRVQKEDNVIKTLCLTLLDSPVTLPRSGLGSMFLGSCEIEHIRGAHVRTEETVPMMTERQ